MVNIWDYANTRPRVKLINTIGESFVGGILMVWDAIETDDEQDSVSLELDTGEIVRFYQSEIESIEVLL